MEAVRAQAFRLYVLLKSGGVKHNLNRLACGIFPEGAQTPFSNKPNRYQMQMLFWQLWRADLLALAPAAGSDVAVGFPLADDTFGCVVSGLGNGWVKRGKEMPPMRPPVPVKLRKQVFERDGRKCVHCGDEHNLTADHIVPVVLGGETSLRNLQTLCRRCNSKKGAKVPRG
jgi:hypothetical protein